MLLYLAFRANYRSATAYELVTVTPSELSVRKVSPSGASAEWTLNPLWVRLDRKIHEEFGIERLFLVSRGRQLANRELSRPRRKGKFARRWPPLCEARRGPTRNAIA